MLKTAAALKNFEEWTKIRKETDDPIPNDLLSCSDANMHGYVSVHGSADLY